MKTVKIQHSGYRKRKLEELGYSFKSQLPYLVVEVPDSMNANDLLKILG